MANDLEKYFAKSNKIFDIIGNRYNILQNCNLDDDIVFIKNGIENIYSLERYLKRSGIKFTVDDDYFEMEILKNRDGWVNENYNLKSERFRRHVIYVCFGEQVDIRLMYYLTRLLNVEFDENIAVYVILKKKEYYAFSFLDCPSKFIHIGFNVNLISNPKSEQIPTEYLLHPYNIPKTWDRFKDRFKGFF